MSTKNYLSWNIGQFRNQLSQKLSVLYTSKRLLWIIICLGVALRLRQYLFNRSLWVDEAFLSLNIINRSFSKLLQPLDYNQGAPIGFLILEKLAVHTFGPSEYALRLFPFLFGTISLFLFYRVAKQSIKPKAVPIALGLFAILPSLIYYSTEVKQYSSDIVIAILLYLVVFYIQSKKLIATRIALFGALGAAAIWFSHSSVFILAGVGVSLILFCLSKKEWARIGGFIIVYSLWTLSFVACYFVSLRELSNSKVFLDLWAGAFMPFPPSSLSDITWFIRTFFSIFKSAGGFSYLFGIAALTFLIGCISIFLRKKGKFFILMSPAFFALLASALHKYPFGGRLLLFFVPSLLLFIAEGAEQIRNKTSHSSTMIGIILIGLLFSYPLYSTGGYLVKPQTKEEIKPVMNYIREHRHDENVIYVYCGAQPAFKYYSKRYGLNNNYIVGISSRDNWRNYINDLNKLRGNKKVWILFSHVCDWKGVNEEKFFLYYLDSIGKRLDSFKSAGAAVYLYNLSEETLKQ